MEEIIVSNVTIPSGRYQLEGRIYRPYEEGKYPAVAICHGYPGDEKNKYLAEELALNGIVTLIFFYRGAWGSTGEWSFTNLDPSTVDAISYLREQSFINPERIGLISHSMGALPLTKRLSEDNQLKTGVLMSPAADVNIWANDEAIDTMVPIFLQMGKGKLQGLNEETLRVGIKVAKDILNPIDIINKVNVPVMIIVGTNDKITPPDKCKKLYEMSNEPKKYVEIEHADHRFSEHRYPLMKHVIEWLEEHLKT